MLLWRSRSLLSYPVPMSMLTPGGVNHNTNFAVLLYPLPCSSSPSVSSVTQLLTSRHPASLSIFKQHGSNLHSSNIFFLVRSKVYK